MAEEAEHGFVFLSDRIAAAMDAANPASLEKVMAKKPSNKKPPPATTKPAASSADDLLRGATTNLLSKASRDVTNMSTLSHGKVAKKTPRDDAGSTSTSSGRRTKRSRRNDSSSTNIAMSASLPNPPITSPIASMHAGIVADDIVPPLPPIAQSSAAPFIKRLTPSEIACITEQSQIILVIPPVESNTLPNVEAALLEAQGIIDRDVFGKMCRGMRASEKEEQMAQLKRSHEILRHGKVAHEYPAILIRYAERSHISRGTESDVSFQFNEAGGAGLRFALCGYSASLSVLFKFKQHIPYIELHKATSVGSVMRDDIKFSSQKNDIRPDLIQWLWRMKGSSAGLMEVTGKYYNAISVKRESIISEITRAIKLAKDEEKSKMDAIHHSIFLSSMKDELTESKLYSFATEVDRLYEARFRRNYNSFTKVHEFVIPRGDIANMYKRFKNDFPHCHAVFSIMVSSTRHTIELAILFGKSDASTDFDFAAVGEDDLADDDELYDEWGESSLHRLERATLEYFLALIRLRSRKQLKFWACLSPLGFHYKGFTQPLKKTHLNSAQCTIRTAWTHCNAIVNDVALELRQRILDMPSVTLAADNWQVNIPKGGQDTGKAAIFHNGTAYFLMQNKVFVLPIGAKMTSPYGVAFVVSAVDECDLMDPRRP